MKENKEGNTQLLYQEGTVSFVSVQVAERMFSEHLGGRQAFPIHMLLHGQPLL